MRLIHSCYHGDSEYLKPFSVWEWTSPSRWKRMFSERECLAGENVSRNAAWCLLQKKDAHYMHEPRTITLSSSCTLVCECAHVCSCRPKQIALAGRAIARSTLLLQSPLLCSSSHFPKECTKPARDTHGPCFQLDLRLNVSGKDCYQMSRHFLEF